MNGQTGSKCGKDNESKEKDNVKRSKNNLFGARLSAKLSIVSCCVYMYATCFQPRPLEVYKTYVDHCCSGPALVDTMMIKRLIQVFVASLHGASVNACHISVHTPRVGNIFSAKINIFQNKV